MLKVLKARIWWNSKLEECIRVSAVQSELCREATHSISRRAERAEESLVKGSDRLSSGMTKFAAMAIRHSLSSRKTKVPNLPETAAYALSGAATGLRRRRVRAGDLISVGAVVGAAIEAGDVAAVSSGAV